MIVVVNYGMGNIGSIVNMLKKVRSAPRVAESGDQLTGATAVILPGVGAFDHGMQNLRSRGFVEPLSHLVQECGVPVLGICLGMQLLTHGSEEGDLPGLGWVTGKCERFRFDASAGKRIPHMGWNHVRVAKESKLFPDAEAEQRFYFVHSYRLVGADPDDILAVSEYGDEFPSAFERKNVAGMQFHPEKSHRFGLQLFERFVSQVT